MKYFIIAGEASGDLHASCLMRELKKRDASADFAFLGGDLMAKEGGQQIIHYRDMAFMGIVNVLINLKKIRRNMEKCLHALNEFRPDAVILIDYPSFNLRVAKYVKQHLKTPVFYYISPKIWAWKTFRIKAIKRYIDGMFTILPFETEFYARYDFSTTYVGNPTKESIDEFLPTKTPLAQFAAQNGLSDKPIVALLAGSRKQEIRGCLPKMLSVSTDFPDYQFVVAGAPGVSEDFYRQVMGGSMPKVIFGDTYNLVANSYAAIVNSGTATLETALLKTPQVVVYHVFGGVLASVLKKLVIKTRYISLVNLIADKELVSELVAHQFTRRNMIVELTKILNDKAYRQTILESYAEIDRRLLPLKAAENAAEGIINRLV
ncbi:MAG: lipid-A-disaccharide synthase [Paludibacteraceae bacterium]|jgi:lipid-A-disaccharide synthase|nr:lipid-A-disaccharide synthase [Paludibacteraceae bacterium]MDI9537292.1 lipid-A-disaccharide synthase [Bacteroidota bacterium]HHT61051.1 lipid-A-disaccharide synthase [Bacteroidales bacterium]MBP9038926.1 lipid-A-disaccharide synthase [Paludibacteraceae bacterium]HOA46377.1 lipid-A-disaccharide synthase [Paludibacteraceae bacterium]